MSEALRARAFSRFASGAWPERQRSEGKATPPDVFRFTERRHRGCPKGQERGRRDNYVG